jgi:hypothetical protein
VPGASHQSAFDIHLHVLSLSVSEGLGASLSRARG